MYDNILIPVSPDEVAQSENALKCARAMLNEGGTITVITVLEVPPSYIAHLMPEEQAQEVFAKEEARMTKDLGALGATSYKVVYGHAARAILDEADAAKSDCIVIASHRPGARHFFLGSTATRVVRRAECSVHVLR